ncbi:hypothetical protein CFII64_24139 [Pseudomonas sp. CFII64]|nr:hypothetical protein CFII64_24139 [Pseudomonas sp. CFII64]
MLEPISKIGLTTFMTVLQSSMTSYGTSAVQLEVFTQRSAQQVGAGEHLIMAQ